MDSKALPQRILIYKSLQTGRLIVRNEPCGDTTEYVRADDNPYKAALETARDALKWFIDDIDGNHTVMIEFDNNVERSRATILKIDALLTGENK